MSDQLMDDLLGLITIRIMSLNLRLLHIDSNQHSGAKSHRVRAQIVSIGNIKKWVLKFMDTYSIILLIVELIILFIPLHCCRLVSIAGIRKFKCSECQDYIPPEWNIAAPDFENISLRLVTVHIFMMRNALTHIDPAEVRLLLNRDLELARIDTVASRYIEFLESSIHAFKLEILHQGSRNFVSKRARTGLFIKGYTSSLILLPITDRGLLLLSRLKKDTSFLRPSIYSDYWWMKYTLWAKVAATYQLFEIISFHAALLFLVRLLHQALERQNISCGFPGSSVEILAVSVPLFLGAHVYHGVTVLFVMSCACQYQRWKSFKIESAECLDKVRRLNEFCHSEDFKAKDRLKNIIKIDQLLLSLSLKSLIVKHELRRCSRSISACFSYFGAGGVTSITLSLISQLVSSTPIPLVTQIIVFSSLGWLNTVAFICAWVSSDSDRIFKLWASIGANSIALKQRLGVRHRSFGIMMYEKLLSSYESDELDYRPETMGYIITYKNIIEVNFTLISIALLTLRASR